MSDAASSRESAVRWVAATVWPLTKPTDQSRAAARSVPAARPVVGVFAGPEGEGCPLSAEERRILQRELKLAGGVL